jgi:hypothetical protein
MITLPKFTQENVLTLLCFDETNCLLARNAVTKELFDHPYQEVAEKAMDYIDRYKVPPKDHIADELEPYLNSAEGDQYKELLKSIYKLNENLNTQYVIDKLLEFIRGRKFETALYDAAALQLKGNIDEAEEVIHKAINFKLTLFDAGVKLTDLSFLAKNLEEENIYSTGIHALDAAKVGPANKQLYVFLGKKSCGKSWHVIQMSKVNILLNQKIAHITLEISKELCQQRYIQNFLSFTKWQMDMVKSPFFVRDNGKITRVDQKLVLNRPSLEDADVIDKIQEQWAKFGPRLENNLRIKEFFTGQLTMSHLRGYLDNLERTENFIPDILIIDQASHMKLNRSNKDDFRISLGGLYIDLRGLAVERNLAVVTNHHINRAGAMAKFTTGEHVSEDFSILATADTGIVYNQRPAERKYKLARLWVDRGRSQKSGFMVLVAQNYDLGQFSLDSDILPNSYNPDAGNAEEMFDGTNNSASGDVELIVDE